MPLYDNTPPSDARLSISNHQVVMYIEKPPEGGYYQPFTQMVGFSLTDIEAETIAATYAKIPTLRNGVHYNRERLLIPELPMRYGATVGFPQGLWLRTALSPYVRIGNQCPINVYLVPTCADDCSAWAFWFEDVVFGPLQMGNPIEVDNEGTVVEATAPFTFTEPRIIFGLRGRIVRTNANPLHTVSFCDRDCVNCQESCTVGVFGGAAADTGLTDDMFATDTAYDVTAVTTILPAAIFTDEECLGGNGSVVYTYADTIDPATATTGGIAYTLEGEGGALIDVGLTVAFFAVFAAGGRYIAAGSGGAVYESTDLLNWTQLAAAVTTTDFYSGVYDPYTGDIWLVGVDGGADAAYKLEGGSLIDVTTVVNGGSAGTGFRSIGLLGNGHVAVGSLDGRLLESVSTPTEAAFTQVYLNAGGNPITVIVGDRSRQIIGVGTQLLERSVLTNRDFTAVPFTGTAPTGNYTDGDLCLESNEIYNGANTFIFVTDDGELVKVAPCPYR